MWMVGGTPRRHSWSRPMVDPRRHTASPKLVGHTSDASSDASGSPAPESVRSDNHCRAADGWQSIGRACSWHLVTRPPSTGHVVRGCRCFRGALHSHRSIISVVHEGLAPGTLSGLYFGGPLAGVIGSVITAFVAMLLIASPSPVNATVGFGLMAVPFTSWEGWDRKVEILCLRVCVSIPNLAVHG